MEKKKIALFLDAPNMLRQELNLSITDITKAAENYGQVCMKRAYVLHHISEKKPKLIEALFNGGFDTKLVLGSIDTTLTTDAIEAIINLHDVSIIALASRDITFLPVFHKAQEYGKETLAIYTTFGGVECNSIRNTATYSVDLVKYPR